MPLGGEFPQLSTGGRNFRRAAEARDQSDPLRHSIAQHHRSAGEQISVWQSNNRKPHHPLTQQATEPREHEMVITRFGNKRIGIIGAGVAGLHLALRLQQMNVDCTIITEHAPDEVAASRLANTVVHWPATLGRERILRVSHWSEEQFGFSRIDHIVQSKRPIEIHGRTSAPARAVDYRVYLPRLMEDFVERGGRLEVRSLNAQDIGRVADRFDLVVVATPHRGFANLFARDAANSPYQQPQRAWMAGLFTGFSADAARGATLSISPGHGEAIRMPMLSRNGMTTALLISSWQPEQPMLPAELSSSADQAGLPAALLRELEQHHPAIYGQIDTARFDLQDARDLARVAITPVVRDPVVHLGDGKCAIALGDTHVTFDPVLAQGANIGSYSAFVLACAIQKTGAFDQTFCQAIERARSARVLGAARWTNAFLQPSDEARAELLKAMSKDEFLADEYLENFNRPEQQWTRVRSPETIRAWIRERQLNSAPNLAAA
jgi:2-polyprenyl-6-methoxyphenol hydroxylase-like FAD-dependent oxidoreductase